MRRENFQRSINPHPQHPPMFHWPELLTNPPRVSGTNTYCNPNLTILSKIFIFSHTIPLKYLFSFTFPPVKSLHFSHQLYPEQFTLLFFTKRSDFCILNIWSVPIVFSNFSALFNSYYHASLDL